MIHIGEKIKAKVQERKLNLGEFAKAINKSRPLVYDIFERESIDTGLLLKISAVLDYNFFHLYIPDQEGIGAKLALVEKLKEQLKMATQSLELAKLEIDYLKKINTLLEEKNSKI